MRVLQITIYGELKFGGPPQKIFALSDGLTERGYDVDIATFHSDTPRGQKTHNRGKARIHFLSWAGRSLWQLPTDWRRLRRAVRSADIVHVYGLYNLLCPLAAWMAVWSGKPFLLEPLGMFVPRTRNMRSKAIYNRWITSPMAKRAVRVVATSPREREELTTLTDPDKLVLRRNGLDLSVFDNLPSGTNFRNRFDIASEEKIILYIGRISPIKNLEELIRAFAHADFKQTRLALVGPELEPDYARRLHALAHQLHLGERLLFTGELYGEDKLSALCAADIFVLPSTYESYGNAAAEAVAAGIPVLLTHNCGIAPLIHEKAGLAVEPDKESLMRGLQTLMDSAQCRSLIARRVEALLKLSWSEPLDQTEAIYNDIVTNYQP